MLLSLCRQIVLHVNISSVTFTACISLWGHMTRPHLLSDSNPRLDVLQCLFKKYGRFMIHMACLESMLRARFCMHRRSGCCPAKAGAQWQLWSTRRC